MAGLLHKVKDALTPGHHHHGKHSDNTTGNTVGTGANTVTPNTYDTTTTSVHHTNQDSAVLDGTTNADVLGYQGSGSTLATGATGAGYATGAPVTGAGYAANTPAVGQTGMAVEVGNVAAPVPVGEKVFTVLEDHAVEKERVETWVEHRPVDREFVTTVEATGLVKELPAFAEGVTVQDRVVAESTCYPVDATVVTGVMGTAVGPGGRTL